MTQFFTFCRYCCVMLAMGISISGFAQNEATLRPVSTSYAITGATIVPAPGQKIEKGTIVIKNGLIHAVGKEAVIPADAIVIKADSLFVYAGFIDGFSHAGVTQPKTDNKEKVKDPSNPPPDRAGITPQVDVRDFINPGDRMVADLREQGFAVSQVVPHGNMLPGQGAIILLSGKTVDEMILTPYSSFYSELTGTPGVYPTTIMGVMAKWRELYRQATLAKNYEAMYASNPSGLERPVSDQILQSFYPIIDKRQSVLFKSEKVIETQRILSLKNDLGFSLMLADVKEGWPIINKVKNSGAVVYLSLALPDEKKKNDKDSTASAEKKALEKKKAETIANYVSQAAAYSKAGIRFGFSANSVQAKDIQPNLRRMIAAGLSEETALAALTTVPAQFMGLSSRIGTIEKGKIANLVLTDKSYFTDKAKVKTVFVDGKMYGVEDSPKTDNTKKADINGSWSYSTETPQGKGGGKLVINSKNGNYNGTITNNFSGKETTVQDIILNGSSLSFSYTIDIGGNALKIDVSAKVNGDSFEGNMVAGQFGTFPMTARKDPK